MEQLDLFGNAEKGKIKDFKILNGEYIYVQNFFNKKEADAYFKILLDSIEWKQESMNMYGKQVNFPRLSAWYGEKETSYRFSGITFSPLPWTQELVEIKKKIEPKAQTLFNSVLLNRYRDGKDSISWHTDAEKELGKNPVIASVNFGAERKFQLKHIESGDKVELKLKHGSLLIMKGELQHYWKHQIPKTKIKVRERINLTFRVIK